MAKTPPNTPQSADLTADKMRAAIGKIDRRVVELRAFDPADVSDRKDVRITTLETAMEQFLLSTFGIGTIEYARYRDITSIDAASYNMNGTPIGEVRKGLVRGRDRAIAILEQIKVHFEEELADGSGGGGEKILRAYGALDLHPEIARAASDLYRDGYYANAIEDSVKALNAFVRLRSGLDEDGDTLMRKAFTPHGPVLAFNALADDSDRNEQKGFMELFAGAVAGLRNPRAHKIVKDDPERALEFIAFVSLLAKLADDAKKVRTP